MVRPTLTPKPGDVFAELGIPEPDVELAKGDLAVRIQRLAVHRRFTPDEAAALLKVPKSDLPALFRGALATCSIDQLLQMLMWLGDDIEIVLRPRLQRTKRGALRVLQAAAVERPDDFEPVRSEHRTRRTANAPRSASPDEPAEPPVKRDDRQLLDKHALEKMTSLDITTIYRKMTAGTFPQPVKVGRRRVAWRTSDVLQWQRDLEVGTETARWRAARSRDGAPGSEGGGRRGRR